MYNISTFLSRDTKCETQGKVKIFAAAFVVNIVKTLISIEAVKVENKHNPPLSVENWHCVQ